MPNVYKIYKTYIIVVGFEYRTDFLYSSVRKIELLVVVFSSVISLLFLLIRLKRGYWPWMHFEHCWRHGTEFDTVDIFSLPALHFSLCLLQHRPILNTPACFFVALYTYQLHYLFSLYVAISVSRNCYITQSPPFYHRQGNLA